MQYWIVTPNILIIASDSEHPDFDSDHFNSESLYSGFDRDSDHFDSLNLHRGALSIWNALQCTDHGAARIDHRGRDRIAWILDGDWGWHCSSKQGRF